MSPRTFSLLDIYRKAHFLDVKSDIQEGVDWQEVEDFIADCRCLDNPAEIALPKLDAILNYCNQNSEWDSGECGGWFATIAKEITPYIPATEVVFDGFSDGVDTLCQGMSLGSTECGVTGLALPALYLTRESAQAEIDADKAEFEQEILDGDRDDDDEFDRELVRVQILADGSVYFPDAEFKTDVVNCTGCNPSDVDVRRVIAFSKEDCLDYSAEVSA